jgi:hypothetical protein
MAFWRKENQSALDRAMADLERQIATVQRQVRVVETGGKPQSPVAAKAETVTKFVKEILTPPKPAVPATKPRRDLFDAVAEPLKDLEAAPIAFAAHPEPDLFVSPKRINCAPKPEEKLGIYISAGSLQGFKRPLRVEQRRNRNRFFMWLGLACVALWFIWAVVR